MVIVNDELELLEVRDEKRELRRELKRRKLRALIIKKKIPPPVNRFFYKKCPLCGSKLRTHEYGSINCIGSADAYIISICRCGYKYAAEHNIVSDY